MFPLNMAAGKKSRFRINLNETTNAIASMSEPKTSLHGRDARNGEFTTIREARLHPNTHIVERVPKPGYGDTKSDNKKK
jgi:hypothetical protein